MSGATSFTSVPIVDIGGLRSPDRAEREHVAAEIGKAAREVGFFYISGAGIDDEMFERMLAATKEFFALPLDEKMRSYIGLSKCHRGYVPAGEEGLATGMPEMNGAAAWIAVPAVPGTFVVNIGDTLELWPNGEFVATSHRVRRVGEERYSFPLFFNVDYHTEVKPLPQFVSRGGEVRPTLRAGEHLFAQTAQTFAYLRNRVDSGDLVLPDGSLGVGQFGQQALQNRG